MFEGNFKPKKKYLNYSDLTKGTRKVGRGGLQTYLPTQT